MTPYWQKKRQINKVDKGFHSWHHSAFLVSISSSSCHLPTCHSNVSKHTIEVLSIHWLYIGSGIRFSWNVFIPTFLFDIFVTILCARYWELKKEGSNSCLYGAFGLVRVVDIVEWWTQDHLYPRPYSPYQWLEKVIIARDGEWHIHGSVPQLEVYYMASRKVCFPDKKVQIHSHPFLQPWGCDASHWSSHFRAIRERTRDSYRHRSWHWQSAEQVQTATDLQCPLCLSRINPYLLELFIKFSVT